MMNGKNCPAVLLSLILGLLQFVIKLDSEQTWLITSQIMYGNQIYLMVTGLFIN